MEERTKDDLEEIKKRLAAIEVTIQRLPEVQAVTFLTMYDEYQNAKFRGKKATDLWVIENPESGRKNP